MLENDLPDQKAPGVQHRDAPPGPSIPPKPPIPPAPVRERQVLLEMNTENLELADETGEDVEAAIIMVRGVGVRGGGDPVSTCHDDGTSTTASGSHLLHPITMEETHPEPTKNGQSLALPSSLVSEKELAAGVSVFGVPTHVADSSKEVQISAASDVGRRSESVRDSGSHTDEAEKQMLSVMNSENPELAVKAVEVNRTLLKETHPISLEETHSVSEIERVPDDTDDDVGKSNSGNVRDSELLTSWDNLIRSEKGAELVEYVRGMEPSQLVMVETAGWKRDQTVLHIAAKSNDAELAILVLDKLLEFRQLRYTVKMTTDGQYETYKEIPTIGEYIRAVEKKSRKSAFELAKEQNWSEKREVICEKIIDTLNRSEAHTSIDRAVTLHHLYELDRDGHLWLKSAGLNQGRIGRESEWLRKVISIRDCTLLKSYLVTLEAVQEETAMLQVSLEKTANLSYSVCEEDVELWKFEDDSGRTLLHVAVMQGDFFLAQLLLDIARKNNDPNYIEAIDSESGLTALKMADDIMGNKSIAEYIKNTLELLKDASYVHSSFSEAYPQTAWWRALKGGYASSKYLGDLLKENHHLLLQTWNGFTVLHAAILFNNRLLLRQILKMFREGEKVSFGDSYYPSELTWEEMTRQEACVHEHIFNENIKETWSPEILLSFRAIMKDRPSLKVSTMELIKHFFPEIDGEEVGNDTSYKKLYKIQKKDIEEMGIEVHVFPADRIFYGIPNQAEMKQHIEDNWSEKWNAGFNADVDFNFETEPRRPFLKVHYACKHPIIFKEYLQDMSSFKGLLIYYGGLHDAQGRTMFHILIDHCTTQVHFPLRWILTEVLEDKNEIYKRAQDARGRTLNDILLMKNYLQHNILLENSAVMQYDFNFMKSGTVTSQIVMQYDFNFMKSRTVTSLIDDSDYYDMFYFYHRRNNYDYVISFMLYHVATILKQTSVAQHIWSRILEKDTKRLREMLCGFEPLPFIASSTGNQVLLQLLMEEEVDLTIHDASGRTLLHHAADPTLLEFAALLKCPMIEHCFSTVVDLCEVQKKWNEESKKTVMILPSRELEKRFDVEKVVVSMNVERKACILLLLQAGVDLSQEDKFKKTPNIGPNDDSTFQSWWYDLVVKDSTDKKNSFNQAASALSVVATLVAATSYIGPLQPPMNYTDGLVNTSVKLVRMFMVTNTLAFYLAMTSVILAVVPSLPMPRESVLSELKRAQHILSVSLYLLLMSIVCIILSFGAASMVVMQDQYSFPGSDLLFFPTILGCLLCFIAIVSFLIRVMKLTFYDSPTMRCIYQFSFTKFCKGVFQWCTTRLSPAETASPKPTLRSLLCRNCFAEASVAKTPLQKPALKKSPSSG